jgi:biofilm PGA synthesis N-glycosyltransferase PgaC
MALSNNGSGKTVELLRTEHTGKAGTLNAALAKVRTDLLATIDADTLLGRQSLKRATARLISSIDGTEAVAGAVMARNSRTNFLTRLQEWDYQLGIASIKRSQAIWQSTLVSQGSFSVYRTKAVKAAGGWPDSIGEDIVLTWALLADGATIGFEPTALAFTEVPSRFGRLARQRSRWARGMIEGLKAYGFRILRQRRMASHGIAINLLFPWMDLCYTFAFLPGIVLACTGNFAIVGPLTLAVLPLNLLLSGLMLRMQHNVFDEVHLSIRTNPTGFLSYLFLYQPLMSPLAVIGYVQEVFRRPRTW